MLMMNCNKSAISVFEEFAEEYLNFEKTPKKNIFWLDTMEFLCSRFGNPQNCIPSFHVAGSKGKGSVATMIASILEEGGYKTGLYSSPHIIDFIERIGTCKGPFEESIYEVSVRQLINRVNSISLHELPSERPVTWFELVTLLAMLSFKNAGCDYSVYEVGLGGRLDATNVINPLCCCINQIEKEHTEFLGDTVEKIAAEKAGIIKEGVPVLVAPQKESVREVFRRKAGEKKSRIFFVDEVSTISDIIYKNKRMSFSISSNYFKRPLSVELSLLGDFQALNACMAALAVKTAIPEFEEELIERGLSKASLPGRFEICGNIVFDGAHTQKSICYTMETFGKIFNKKNAHLLFGCASDKDVEDMALLFREKFSHITITKPGSVKECNIERIKKAFNAAGLEYFSCSDFLKAIPLALKKAEEENSILLVTGSFYLVSEVKKYLMCNPDVGKF